MGTLLAWLSSFLTEFGVALIKAASTGALDRPPTQIVDSVPDAPVDTETANEVEASIAAGLTPVK